MATDFASPVALRGSGIIEILPVRGSVFTTALPSLIRKART